MLPQIISAVIDEMHHFHLLDHKYSKIKMTKAREVRSQKAGIEPDLKPIESVVICKASRQDVFLVSGFLSIHI